MQKENRSLWQVRHLWTSLCGDSTWVPCSTMVGTNDIDFYIEKSTARQSQDSTKTGEGASSPAKLNGETSKNDAPGARATNELKTSSEHDAAISADADVPMDDANAPEKRKTPPRQNVEMMETDDGASKEQPTATDVNKENGEDAANGDTAKLINGGGPSTETASHGRKKGSRLPSEDVHMQDGEAANEASHNGVEASQSFIHPMFLPPPNAALDRNLGLPDNEAEDMRKLLSLYVQKQEEVCRGAARLHLGLLRAQRLRKDVLHWSKAEAHSGPNRDMSDGEDWYDKEEWGLTEDLKKGQDEEEEDTTTTGKKTRNRR